MKKNNLFKAVGIVILVYVLFTWIVPIIYSIGGWKADVSNQIGFVSLISVVLETFTGFGSLVLYVLLVGGFYGVLKVTGAYDKVMDYLTEKATGKEKCTLITIIVSMAVVSSISGLDAGLLVLYPILIGLIVKMGYDKLVALSATVGATIIGMYGATLAGTLYGANETVLSVKKYSYIIPKVVLFILGLGALLFFVLKYIKDNKLGPAKTAKKLEVKKGAKKVSAVKAKKDPRAKKGERTAKPAMFVTCILMLVMFLGTTNWGGIFKDNWFKTAHDSWTGLTVGKFKLFEKLFGGVDAFGTWLTPTRFQTYSLLLIIAMVAITILYRTKFSDSFEGFVEGLKSFVVPAILTILACSVFVFVYYNPVINTVMSALLSATKEFNLATAGIYTIINSLFYVDYYYLAYAVLYGVPQVFDDAGTLSIISVMFVNLYSLVMLVAPTSVLLLVSLSISDVKYTDWIKYIWKLALALFVISFVVFAVMMVA